MSYEYDKYLAEHVSNVQKGYLWFEENLPEVVADLTIKGIVQSLHDESEYDAYDTYSNGNYTKERTTSWRKQTYNLIGFCHKKNIEFQVTPDYIRDGMILRFYDYHYDSGYEQFISTKDLEDMYINKFDFGEHLISLVSSHFVDIWYK